MGAIFRKASGSQEVEVDLICHWCGAHVATTGNTVALPEGEAWLVAVCTSIGCGKALLIRVPLKQGAPWAYIGSEHTTTYDDPEVYPAARPGYALPGVPE